MEEKKKEKEEKLKKVPTKEIKPKEEVESNFKYL